MNERINGFINLCSSAGFDINTVKAYIEGERLCAREITYAAYLLTQRYQCELASFVYEKRRAPDVGELVSDGFLELFKLLLGYGLEQGLDYISSDGGVSEESILLSVLSLDNRDVALDTAELLLESGFDPEYRLPDCSVAEQIERELLDYVLECNKDTFAVESSAYRVLLLYSYGAVPRHISVSFAEGYGRESLKDYRLLSVRAGLAEGEIKIDVTDSIDGALVCSLAPVAQPKCG